MIVKMSNIRNTRHAIAFNKTMSFDEMDTAPSYYPHEVVVDWLRTLPENIVLLDGDLTYPEGAIYGLVTEDVLTGEPAIIVIYTRDTPLCDFIEVVTHEMVHAQQMRDGRLAYHDVDGDQFFIWDGEIIKPINPVIPIDCPTIHATAVQFVQIMQYYAQPWEYEAVGGRWDTYFGGREWPYRIVERYGTIWPKHWSPEYVIKRLTILEHVGPMLDEFEKEGY